ncbi:T-cell surface glycoprotein CD4 [Leptodactylus fuscus]
MDIKLEDSGNFTCQYGKSSRTVQLFVFQVLTFPSASLLVSEDLVLELKTSPSSIPGLQVSWEKDGITKLEDLKLEENNMQLNSGGTYICRIKMGGGNSLDITRQIQVFGFHDIPSTVYTTGNNPVTIPWVFNFNIRSKPLVSGVHVVEGSIRYSSQILNQLSDMEGAPGWPTNSNSKNGPEEVNNLSVQLLNPKSGKYQMEILLKMGDQKKNLTREVCVASLTVSDSQSGISPDTRVPLECRVNCLDINRNLCWHQQKTSHEICGQQGQRSLHIEVTAGNETEVTWTCSVTNGKERIVSADVTLEVKSFMDLSNSLFWVMIGVGIFIVILIVLIITLLIARSRRLRRARYRAWLLENLHQQRRCECKGFSPQRLRENF